MLKKLFLTSSLVLASALVALANSNFHLHNNTLWEMEQVYVSPHSSGQLGESLPNPVPAGDESYVYFTSGETPVFTISG